MDINDVPHELIGELYVPEDVPPRTHWKMQLANAEKQLSSSVPFDDWVRLTNPTADQKAMYQMIRKGFEEQRDLALRMLRELGK